MIISNASLFDKDPIIEYSPEKILFSILFLWIIKPFPAKRDFDLKIEDKEATTPFERGLNGEESRFFSMVNFCYCAFFVGGYPEERNILSEIG